MIIKQPYTHKLIRVAALSALFIAVATLFTHTLAVQAAPAVFTVTNTNDSGAGSLRQAVLSANANSNPSDQDVINFSISGLGPHLIQLQSQLTITQSVKINGISQPNSSDNTVAWPLPIENQLRIAITAASGNNPVQVQSDNVTLHGLVFNRFDEGTVKVIDSSNFTFTGNFINSDVNGLSALPSLAQDQNAHGIELIGAKNAHIGGSLPKERNILGYCMKSCITASSSADNDATNLQIEGNYIGIGADAITDLAEEGGTGPGIELAANTNNALIHNNSIERISHGGIQATDLENLTITGNRIMRLRADAITLRGVTNSSIGEDNGTDRNSISGVFNSRALNIVDSPNTSAISENIRVTGNYIGAMEDSSSPLGNESGNIIVNDNSNYVAISRNIIANSTYGIGVDVTNNAQNVSITENSLYNNDELGINLNGGGADQNDQGDGDNGANGSINHPWYSSYQEQSGNTDIEFSTDLKAGNYRIEFYSNSVADPSGFGEGESFLGYTTITSTGAPQNLSYTLSGVTGVTNLSLTATEVDGASPSGFGATSEFGAQAAPVVPRSSFKISKKLNNPQNYVQGGQAQYTITITNDGLVPIDLTQYDSSGGNPLASSIFTDFLPPDLEFNQLTSGNASCFNGGELATLAAPFFANHLDYQALFCAYTGTNTSFNPGDSIDFTFTANILNNSMLSQMNFAQPGSVNGDPGVDVSGNCFNDVIGGTSGDQDVLNCMLADVSGESDLAYSGAPTDVSVGVELSAPQGFNVGNQVAYTITFTNNGPGDVDLSWYNGSVGKVLFADVFPGAQLAYSNSTSADNIDCGNVGPGTAIYVGPAASQHTMHDLVVCTYSGGISTLLQAGSSISVTLHAAVIDTSSTITNYVLHTMTASDPDTNQLNAALQGAIGDILDSLPTSNNNFSRLTYQSESSNNNSNSSQNPSQSNNSPASANLSQTGINLKLLIMMVGIIIIISGGSILKYIYVKHHEA